PGGYRERLRGVYHRSGRSGIRRRPIQAQGSTCLPRDTQLGSATQLRDELLGHTPRHPPRTNTLIQTERCIFD
ncbi:hypothetical protein ACWELB_49425, partial [Streptomyces asiaticus]